MTHTMVCGMMPKSMTEWMPEAYHQIIQYTPYTDFVDLDIRTLLDRA